MHIRFSVESESPETARTFDAYVMDATTGDGSAKAFAALMPRHDGLTAAEMLAEVARLQGAGHRVSGDRAAMALGVPSANAK